MTSSGEFSNKPLLKRCPTLVRGVVVAVAVRARVERRHLEAGDGNEAFREVAAAAARGRAPCGQRGGGRGGRAGGSAGRARVAELAGDGGRDEADGDHGVGRLVLDDLDGLAAGDGELAGVRGGKVRDDPGRRITALL